MPKAADIRSELRRGSRPQGSELTSTDLGRALSIGEGFGVVRPFDLGKRVWHREHGLVMENTEQRDARVARTAPMAQE